MNLMESCTYHLGKTSCSNNVSGMNQAIQVSRRFLDCLPHLIIAVEIEDICYKIQCILVVLNLGVQASKVESICQVLFIDFTKVFVTPR